MTRQVSDEELWQAFKRGDGEAYARLYQLHVRALITYGYRITPDTSLIKDSIHDLFIELWQGRETLSDTDSVRFYLFRSLRNRINRNRKENPFDQSEELPERLQEVVLPAETLLVDREQEEERMHILREALRQLPERQREAVHLRFFQNFTNEETARLMGISYQSAANLLTAAVKSLRHLLRSTLISLIWLVCTWLLSFC
jgi:RNA polymerase sigma factor (sigma-70 family)